MTIKYYPDLVQGSEEWHAQRCGMITASSMKLVLTPTLKIASNDKERAHLYELVAQRTTNYVEPQYVSNDMLRGTQDEIDARIIYSEKYGPVLKTGFVTNDKLGFEVGCSPDGLVGKVGMIEIKSRMQKHQMETILLHAPQGTIPPEFMLQTQAGLFITERKWCDFVSYCGGLPMQSIRIYPDKVVHEAIAIACTDFESRIKNKLDQYEGLMKRKAKSRLIPTERRIEQEMFIGGGEEDE